MAINTQIFRDSWEKALNKAVDTRSAKVVPDAEWRYEYPGWVLYAKAEGSAWFHVTKAKVHWNVLSAAPENPHHWATDYWLSEDIEALHQNGPERDIVMKRVKDNLRDRTLDELLQLAEIKYMMGED